MSKLYTAMFALLALLSCSDNLFGSGGGSEASSCGYDIKCLRLEAEEAFRASNYEAAYKIYGKILELDSTASIGYYGMAKAGLWMEGINPFDVFRFMKRDEGYIPYVGETVKDQNRYLQGMIRAYKPLSNLDRRDSLTALYELHLNNDPNHRERLYEFRKVFCGGLTSTKDCYDTTASKKAFPLSDREYKSASYYGGLLISSMSKAMLEIFDTNKDGCIAKRGVKGVDHPKDNEWDKWRCPVAGKFDLSINLKINEDGSFEIDLEHALSELETLYAEFYEEQLTNPNAEIPDDIKDFNDKLDEFNSNMDGVLSVLNSAGGVNANPNDPNAEPGQWEEDMSKYKDFATFYKIGSRIDEDGDGCIDEELLDGFDNDGDGLNNDNGKLTSSDKNNPNWGRDGINNTMLGNPLTDIDNNTAKDMPKLIQAESIWIRNVPNIALEDCSYETCTEILADSTGVVVVMEFTQTQDYWTSKDTELKLAVARDTVCGQLKYSLAERKTLIGGCWPNYDNEKFIKYWLKRELARDRSRIHPSCQTCVGEACTRKR